MKIQTNYSLIHNNTFGVESNCKSIALLDNLEEAQQFVRKDLLKNEPFLVIGEGSNLLFTKDFPGTIIQMQNKGFKIIKEDDNNVWIQASAGEIWDDFVAWSIENKYYGAENLSKIPGTVGAAPIQNIGAYGVELEEIFSSLEAIAIATGDLQLFDYDQLNFGYRDSIFKQELKNKYIIINVIFKLSKKPHYKIDYGNIQAELEKNSQQQLSPALIRKVISDIRSSKLPEPKDIGNAGSYFKNPLISHAKYQELKDIYTSLVAYDMGEKGMKLAAGWLIDQAGLKGKIKGNVGIHKKQALIIINLGGATGPEILKFSEEVQDIVNKKFGVILEREVNVI